MSASKRAALRILDTLEPKTHLGDLRIPVLAILVDAEYAPAVEALRKMLYAHGGTDDCDVCRNARKTLAHIEGDATP